MAAPVKHDGMSTIATTGYEAGKGALIGGLLAAAVGGVAALGVAAIGGSLLLGSAGAAFGGTAGIITALGVGSASIISFLGLGPISAAVGGLVGTVKGGSRVSKENAAYREAAEGFANTRGHQQVKKMNDAQIAGMQQGYMMGFQEGQSQIVNQLQQAAMDQQFVMNQATATNEKGATAVAAASAKCACGPHSEKVLNEQAAAANRAAGPTV